MDIEVGADEEEREVGYYEDPADHRNYCDWFHPAFLSDAQWFPDFENDSQIGEHEEKHHNQSVHYLEQATKSVVRLEGASQQARFVVGVAGNVLVHVTSHDLWEVDHQEEDKKQRKNDLDNQDGCMGTTVERISYQIELDQWQSQNQAHLHHEERVSDESYNHSNLSQDPGISDQANELG